MAPRKAAKKAAKKAVGKHDPHKAANDARRTFEHMGRVLALSSFTSSESQTLKLLTDTADAAFRAQHYKESADLLRAAEHLSFAALHVDSTETVATDLKTAIKDEFDHLLERSKEHASKHAVSKELHPLRTRLSRDAKAAMRSGAYRAALEFARGAEALSHVHELGTKLLGLAAGQKQLRA